ncbi:hypothetical protein EXIGLDRAFT_744973 [Exidia glandulosa HHB12029]|uniref:CBM1 domain-containing protein n=1 Tax=Exidia glandulosa HHB12029 TaxID=1314781 RepID=A0A166BJE2_EXIGL|nr:hypothetical protein EXIGLDRAFT_744973 [Exidia glandulosa HHB12029]
MISHLVVLSVLSTHKVLGQMVAPVGGTSIFWNPGPRYGCYNWVQEGASGAVNPEKGVDCAPFLNPSNTRNQSRADSCVSFVNDVNGSPTCPTWQFDTWGWSYAAGQLNASPGYAGTFSSGSVMLRNSARDTTDCGLYEVTLSYQYWPGAIIKYVTGDFSRETNLDMAAHFVVEYDVLIESDPTALAGPRGNCNGDQRRFLTTDFIYTFGDQTNLLSIVHFNPTNLGPPIVPWTQNTTAGCRFLVQLPQYTIQEGVQTHIGLDFKTLLQTAGTNTCHPNGLPADIWPQAVQIVTSNVGTNMVVHLSNVDAQLASSTTPVSSGSAPSSSTSPPPPPSSGDTQVKFGQCGGQAWTGPTACAAGTTCQVQNIYYSQCLP